MKRLFLLMVFFPITLFSIIRINDSTVMQGVARIRIFTGESEVVELNNLFDAQPKIRYYNSHPRMVWQVFPSPTNMHRKWLNKLQEKNGDIAQAVKDRTSVIVYFSNTGMPIGYALPGVHVGYEYRGEPKVRAQIGGDCFVQNIQSRLLAHCIK